MFFFLIKKKKKKRNEVIKNEWREYRFCIRVTLVFCNQIRWFPPFMHSDENMSQRLYDIGFLWFILVILFSLEVGAWWNDGTSKAYCPGNVEHNWTVFIDFLCQWKFLFQCHPKCSALLFHVANANLSIFVTRYPFTFNWRYWVLAYLNI